MDCALPGDAILNRLWSSADPWLPGRLLSALAGDGTNATSYTHAVVTLTVYVVIVASGAEILFQRRDA